MSLEKNSKCYKYENIKYDNGIFDEIIDACYVIHLENNGRLENVKKQLNELPLSKNTIICHNKGYKKCEKDLIEQKSTHDLIDAYKQIAYDSIKKNYNGIIILEDDFIYEDALFNPFHQNKIIKYIKKNIENDKDFIYTFGVMPFIQTFNILEFELFHHNVILSGGLHSTFYSKKAIKNIYNNKCNDIDAYFNRYYFYKKYGYCVPLITQIFPETENSKNWKIPGINNQLYNSLKPLIIYLNLHKSTKNYKIFYITSIIAFSLLFNISTYILYLLLISVISLF